MLLNLSSLLFGNYFGLYGLSVMFVALLMIPLFTLMRSNVLLIAMLALVLVLATTAIVQTVPLNKSGGMLMVIDAAAGVLLNGHNPYYQSLEVPLGSQGFIYVPGLLLGYLPPKAIGIDIRYANVGAALAFWLFIATVSLRWNRSTWRSEVLMSFALLTSPFVLHLIATKHNFFFGVLLFILTALVVRERHTLSVVLLGASIVTRQFSVILAPFVLWGNRTRMLLNLVVLTMFLTVVFVPFFPGDASRFLWVLSGNANVSGYDAQPVDFALNFSPGDGGAFNVGHLVKALYPRWSKFHALLIIAVLEAGIVLALRARRIIRSHAMYFSYICYLSFGINFSDYLLWGALCIAWAIVWSEGRIRLTQEE
jgi:hypothetical protein